MALTNAKVEDLMPKEKPYHVTDRDGLVIHVSTAGSKTWRQRYRLKVADKWKERMITLGEFPIMTLAEARAESMEVRKEVAEGVDPVMSRRVIELRKSRALGQTYEAVFREMLKEKETVQKCSPATLAQIKRRHEQRVLPTLGALAIDQITPLMLRAWAETCQAKWPGSARHTATTVREVFTYAVEMEYFKHHSPAANLMNRFPTHEPEKRAALTSVEGFRGLLVDGASIPGRTNQIIYRLQAMLYTRPVEFLKSEWTEFDLDNALWTIPSAKIKTRVVHIVPLPRQAVALLKELKLLGGGSRWVVPNAYKLHQSSHKDRISRLMAKYLPQYKDKHVPHGFRSTASTLLSEAHYDLWIIEVSLAHALPSSVMGIYKEAQWVPYQRAMRQAYADFMDNLTAGMDGAEAMAKLSCLPGLTPQRVSR